MFFERMVLVGTGLIGGSVGLGVRKSYPRLPVVGYDENGQAARAALQRGALSVIAGSLDDAVKGADLVVLAAPVDSMPETCRVLADVVDESAVVTDVGSAKQTVVTHGEAAFGDRFVGGHPMAGSERHGIEAADGRLFQDAWWILTPTSATSSSAYSTVAGLVRLLGAKPVAIDPLAHDALVARLSHLPQLLASTVVDVAAAAGDRDALLGLAGNGFRDVTRIAASNPELWTAVFRSNKDAVMDAVAALQERLSAATGLIERERWDELRDFLSGTRAARLNLFAKPDYGGEPVALSVMVPDKPGVLAEVTTAAGELGVNLEDLRIIHSTEGGQGRLELVVAGKDQAELLVASLSRLGYRVDRSLE